MGSSLEDHLDPDSGSLSCVVDGGCSYLRTLGMIEHLAGFDGPANHLFAMAARCQDEGCWTARRQSRPRPSPEPAHPIPLPSRAARPPKIEGTAGTAIPFVRPELVDRVSDTENNYVERRGLKLQELKRIGSLDYLYEYWRWLRGATGCEFSNIDTAHLMRSGIIGKLHVVDVSGADPQDFQFELAAYAIPVPWPHYRKVRAFPISIYADATMRDYNTVRLTAAPRLQRVRAQLAGRACHYTRLILPFFDKLGSVTRLAVAIHRERGDGAKIAPAR